MSQNSEGYERQQRAPPDVAPAKPPSSEDDLPTRRTSRSVGRNGLVGEGARHTPENEFRGRRICEGTRPRTESLPGRLGRSYRPRAKYILRRSQGGGNGCGDGTVRAGLCLGHRRRSTYI